MTKTRRREIAESIKEKETKRMNIKVRTEEGFKALNKDLEKIKNVLKEIKND